MGYESRLYIVKKCSQINYAEKIAIFDCSCMGYNNGWKELFNKPFDCTLYLEDGDTEVEKDCYGEELKCADFSAVIEWLEKEVKKSDYRRLKPLLGLLKSFDLSQWTDGEMLIVHYGY